MKLIKVIFLILSLTLTVFAREKVNVNLSNLEIQDFIKLVSKISDKNILINNNIRGTVNFISTSPVYDDELVDILISVLESKGFTLVEKGSFLEVVRSVESSKHNTKVMPIGKKLDGSFMITQPIRLDNENVAAVAAKIRHLISKTAKLVTIKSSNTILITDYPSNIETIKKVIDEISDNNKFIVKIVPVKHIEAKKLQVRLDDIAKSIFNKTVESQKVSIAEHDSINGLIIVGNRSNVAILETLIEKLDVESNINKTVKIHNLKNSDAKLVLTSLNEIISKQTFADPTMKPNVSSNEELNAIIVVGEPDSIKGIELIIEELDKEKYQVYVRARIIEINRKNTEELGVKYGFSGGDVSASGLYAMSANFGDNDLTATATKSVLEYISTIGAGDKNAFALGATIDFLQIYGASKSISNPSILCVNNKESSIYVGKTLSVSSGQTSATAGTTTSYKREDVGLTLKIKPRVSSLDKVTLDIETVLENILDDGSKNATGQPVTSKQEVKTQAILLHGESIIIGGLVKTYDNKSTIKVPFLSDIPFIGKALFTSSTISVEQDSLVVILTPYIINKSENLSELQRDLGKLSKIQKEYNDKIFSRIKESEKI
ncbi:MAG: hypothetical protein JJV95_07485 [Sulfurospirillum sp.]|nr:hypothetical protein [Sulfurospirillum sp.]